MNQCTLHNQLTEVDICSETSSPNRFFCIPEILLVVFLLETTTQQPLCNQILLWSRTSSRLLKWSFIQQSLPLIFAFFYMMNFWFEFYIPVFQIILIDSLNTSSYICLFVHGCQFKETCLPLWVHNTFEN